MTTATMPEILVTGPLESQAIAWIDRVLAARPAPVTVASYIARPRPAGDLVRIQSAGGLGRRSLVLEDKTLIADAYSPDETTAEQLADLVHGALLAMPGAVPDIYRVTTIGGPYHQDDPQDADLSRYTVNVGVLVRARAWPPPTTRKGPTP